MQNDAAGVVFGRRRRMTQEEEKNIKDPAERVAARLPAGILDKIQTWTDPILLLFAEIRWITRIVSEWREEMKAKEAAAGWPVQEERPATPARKHSPAPESPVEMPAAVPNPRPSGPDLGEAKAETTELFEILPPAGGSGSVSRERLAQILPGIKQ